LGVLPKNQNYTLIFGLAFLAENLLMLSALAIQLRFYFKAKEKKFTSEIVEALENERIQIAMNLHDELGGSLSTVKRKLEDVILGLNNQAHYFLELVNIFDIIKVTNQTLRSVSHNLAPAELQRIGFIKSLEQLCNSINSSNLRVDFYHSGKSSKLSHQIEVNLYRIAAEALQNIVKHSGASNAEVSINFFEKELNLIVSDNGSWKISEKIGMGLKNIRIRVEYLNGILNIDKGSNGTQLTVELSGL
jgi:signal transduction histidine kinase